MHKLILDHKLFGKQQCFNINDTVVVAVFCSPVFGSLVVTVKIIKLSCLPQSTKDIATIVNVTNHHKLKNVFSWQTMYKPFRNSFIGDTSL